MANYGDVALGLPADWERNIYGDNEFVLTTVGHSDGTADAYLTNHPEEKHHFYWCDPTDQRDIIFARQRGFDFCQKAEWSMNEMIWRWDAEGRIEAFGLRLMFRPAERYFRDIKRREDMQNRAKADADSDAVPDGLVATDASGQVLKPVKRGRPARA